MVSWIGAVDRQTVSDLTGTLSFCIWLFAQSPQLYENYRRGSVEGLSAVFLTQWMLGDATNLIGSVLTQQLPFQIAVATYFCCIDVCIMVQFVYYWSKARKERARLLKNRSRQRSSSLTSPYPPNPYSVLSETSELLGSRSSRHNSFLRSTSRRRVNLSHSQQLTHPNRHAAQHAHPHKDPHAPLEPRASTDTPADAPQIDRRPQRPRYESSRSRSRHAPPISRNGSSDTVSGAASGSVANYRALSDAALSVAQLAQEAARRREAMLHQVHGADEDYFSHRRSHSYRSKSRASSSPNHSLPPSRTRSRVNSNEVDLQRDLKTDLTASTQSLKAAGETAPSAARRSRATRSMSSRRKAAAGNVDFVPSALSPTRESKDIDESDAAATVSRPAEDDGETEPESVSEAESASRDEAAEAENLMNSIDSLESVGTASSSASAEPRGRDMMRTATRIDTAPPSGAVTPVIAGDARRDACSPFSGHSSSDGTARHASPHSKSRDVTDRMSQSLHQLGSHETTAVPQDSDEEITDKYTALNPAKTRKRRTHDSTRESSPAAPLHRSIDTLVKDGGRKRSMVRSSSSRSHSKRMASSGLIGPSSSTGKKRTGTKSPASMRRSIGMVLLGIMMVTSLPSSTVSAAAIPDPSSGSLSMLSLFDGGATWRRVVGRISAWLCALLYITSRIPQIWENHIRRSVAGLSILLFIAAFSGNLLYTISVLTNPSAQGEGSRMYLQESLPFLLGSGGTLIFDLMIVGQWAAWRHKGAVE
ncbi:pq loop repeat protein [Pseudozyma hubeiensis SY62]|uniref:Pq loop repeat protein n=1 Tax=Pseudozyma hubeiensis (strain SY62) TaxID=1305764 RepID=R9P5B3_PSEHS|nr:pq loop repeat protein [Pseudozyma hubeiensis SY62]GAC96407.1 pq loop repeat protein [Pseudozyma hubeiensis SY62]